MPKIDGRNDNERWRRARRRAIRRANGLCQLCWQPLNPDALRAEPDATEIDHIVELSKGGDAYDDENLRAVHRRCHQRRAEFETERRLTEYGGFDSKGRWNPCSRVW